MLNASRHDLKETLMASKKADPKDYCRISLSRLKEITELLRDSASDITQIAKKDLKAYVGNTKYTEEFCRQRAIAWLRHGIKEPQVPQSVSSGKNAETAETNRSNKAQIEAEKARLEAEKAWLKALPEEYDEAGKEAEADEESEETEGDESAADGD